MTHIRSILFFSLMGMVLQIYALGEAVPFSLLQQLLPSNPIILEAGAQFGEDTSWMSEMWPCGTIYAFEPSPESFPALAKVASQHSNIIIHKLALSNQVGELPFYLSGGASSLLKPTDSFNQDYFHADLEHPIMVPVTTFDLWVQENDVDHIDFMWLDMEGNELNALKGSLSILSRVKVIYAEVNLQNFWHGCVKYEELITWLENQGFEKIWEDITPHWHGNVVFVNKNL